MANIGPSRAKNAFRLRHFGTTFSVVSAKFGRFSKTHFLQNPGVTQKHKHEDGRNRKNKCWPFFEDTDLEFRVAISRLEM